MSIETLSAHLERLEVFQDLAPEQLDEIARRAERIVYKPGQLLMADGEPGDAAVLVISGTAKRVKGHLNADEHEVIEPGVLLGEMAMLIETEHSSTVVAEEAVRALRIPRDAMMELMLADPSLAEHFVAKIARRLSKLADELRRIDAILAAADEAAGIADATDDQGRKGAVSMEAAGAGLAG